MLKTLFRNKFFAIISICLLGILIYSNTFSSSFHLDDNRCIARNIDIQDIANLGAIFNFWPTRFIAFFSIALNYHLNQLHLFGWHLFNLIVHLASAVLAWWFILLTFSTPAIRNKAIAGYAVPCALFSGLIFVAHPIQTQSVTYIIQRITSLSALFYLASLCLYSKSRLSRNGLQGRKASTFYYSASLLLTVVAMFTKESTITLPIMILMYELFFFDKKDTSCRRVVPFLLCLAVIPLTMLFTRSVDFLEMKRVQEGGNFLSSNNYFLTQFRVVVTYLRLLFFPLGQNLDYDYSLSKTLLGDFSTLPSFLFLLLVLLFALKAFRRHKLISFSIFFFFLVLAPESSVIPIKDVIFEHRLYLAMVGYILFIVSSAYSLFGKNHFKLIAVFLSFLICIYSIMAYTRNVVWKDEFSLWNDVIKKSPRKARAYLCRGNAYVSKGRIDKAIVDYTAAIAIHSQYAQAYSSRGFAYHIQGNFKEAILDYDRAIKIKPDYAQAYNDRGVIYQSSGDLGRSISDYSAAIDINPYYFEAYNNRGVIYQARNNLEQAILNYSKAIEINPHYGTAYRNRATAYCLYGEYDKCLRDISKSESLGVKFDPEALKIMRSVFEKNDLVVGE